MDLQFVHDGRRYRLTPEGVDAVLKMSMWDRHAVFHATCRQMYGAEHPDGPPDGSALSQNGFEVVPGCLSRAEAGRLSGLITEGLEALGPDGGAHGPVSDDPDLVNVTVPFEGDMLDALRDTLAKALNPDVETALEAYYGSYFRIDVVTAYRTHALETHTTSFLWHRDLAPMAQVHVILYLTDSGPDAGSTMLLTLDQTREAAELGYHYTKIDDRRFDLDDLGPDAATRFAGQRPDIAAGDALLFAAPRVLHRGSLPTTGFRDTFTLVLQPSMVPWRQDLEDFGDRHIFLGHTKSTLTTNPFEPLAPIVAAENQPHIAMPAEWAVRGDLFPSPGLVQP